MSPRPAPPAFEPSAPFAYAAWLLAAVATLGSLFLSEVMDLPPCSLCWYQRICLFPLTVVIAVGIVLRDRHMTTYALPLCGAGTALALYHNLLYYGVIPQTLSPCRAGVACTERQLDLLGFIGIPLMSLGAFVAIGGSLLLHLRAQRRTASPGVEAAPEHKGTTGSRWP